MFISYKHLYIKFRWQKNLNGLTNLVDIKYKGIVIPAQQYFTLRFIYSCFIYSRFIYSRYAFHGCVLVPWALCWKA